MCGMWNSWPAGTINSIACLSNFLFMRIQERSSHWASSTWHWSASSLLSSCTFQSWPGRCERSKMLPRVCKALMKHCERNFGFQTSTYLSASSCIGFICIVSFGAIVALTVGCAFGACVHAGASESVRWACSACRSLLLRTLRGPTTRYWEGCWPHSRYSLSSRYLLMKASCIISHLSSITCIGSHFLASCICT